VYYIWKERNSRIFRKEKRDSTTILNTVKQTVEMKLLGMKSNCNGSVHAMK
ncbi:hypothetical protein Tco_1481923, partial [Tanacetum coccineum]